MGKIHRLSAELANQIAAGEVVERPSSVAKELIENALDAGATRVRIDVAQGGLELVRVSDDGEGMTEADAWLSLERHATSKIASIGDLSTIGTFGFRGEALPSIASVSRLVLTTRHKDSGQGIELTSEGGNIVEKPSPRAIGTTVEVRDLFYNVPARRKFLKSAATESAHVGEVALWAALSRHDVSITLGRDGRIAREYLRVGTRRERASQALNEARLVECIAERGAIRIEAHLGPPERARSGAVALYVLVNGRPVKDRLLARAVAQAYGSVLEPGRYPVGVVYIDLPPGVVDVNVHPQKAEVRFQDARALHDAITRELFERLARSFSIPSLGPPSRPWMRPPSSSSSREPAQALYPSLSESWTHALGDGAPRTDPEPVSEEPRTQPSLFEEPQGFYRRLRFLAQVRSTYLVCEGDDGLYVIDQHAADERVNFDKLRAAFAAREIASQRLLTPELVNLQPIAVALFTEHEAEVSALGLDVRAVGSSTVAVHAVPMILARASAERLVHDVLSELSRAAARPFSGAADLVIATMACHGSVRAGDAMSPQQARALLESLDKVDFSGHCPHGRPVVMRLSYAELERRVGR